jgi:hypothetical protein
MAVTNAQASEGKGSGKSGTPKTLLNDDVTMPSYVAPGDGPYDTVDPTERATSVTPDKGAAALKGFGVVNAVVPLPPLPKPERDSSEDRIETYEAVGPDGKPVKITHNIDTGETSKA